MSASITGVHCHSLRILHDVLNAWILANLRTVRAWKTAKDVPWWYNERASLSLLAGAVWQSGGVAFEEYSEDKRGIDHRKLTYRGRNDLYFKFRQREFICEAKQAWCGATRIRDRSSTRIEGRLDDACADIRKVSPRGQRRLGILFAVPYIARSERANIDTVIERWVDALARLDCCCAWVFPKSTRQVFHKPYVYPGVAVLLREV